MENELIEDKPKTCFWCGEEASHKCYGSHSFSCDFCCMREGNVLCNDHGENTERSKKLNKTWLDKVRAHLWKLQGITNESN